MNYRFRFLYIDDDPDDAEILADYFRREFDNIEVVYLRRPLEDPEGYRDFDAVILDYYIMPPGRNGLEIAKQIHAFDWHIPIMILSGHDKELSQNLEAWSCVDSVVSKNHVHKVHGELLSMIRWLTRLREAKS